MNFFHQTGKMALGSRLRRLSERISDEARRIYQLYDIDMEPRWFPVYYVLADESPTCVGDIAKQIGHSHASVSQIVKEMTRHGWIDSTKSTSDGRKTMLSLSAKGTDVGRRIRGLYGDVGEAVDQVINESNHDLWEAIEEMEYLLQQRSLFERVRRTRKERVAQMVEMIDATPSHYDAFRRLNEAWITKYFQMETSDIQSLHDPEKYIIRPGGLIIMAALNGEIIGTCAMIRLDADTFELAKMAVDPSAQGLGIGYLLGKAILDRSRQLGAKRVYLESNTRLKPAIQLYHKLGFQRIVGRKSPYERSNIQMEVWL